MKPSIALESNRNVVRETAGRFRTAALPQLSERLPAIREAAENED